jgi:hypothetical protein
MPARPPCRSGKRLAPVEQERRIMARKITTEPQFNSLRRSEAARPQKADTSRSRLSNKLLEGFNERKSVCRYVDTI